MQTLEDIIEEVVEGLIQDECLFTALDVSNKVKEKLPLARHSEVSAIVRNAFSSLIEPWNYARTPITVTLKDGSTATALLYHPNKDAWDLDAKYDAQQRSQVSKRPTVLGNSVSDSSSDPSLLASDLSNQVPVLPLVNVIVPNPPLSKTPKDSPAKSPSSIWARLLNAQFSLFPKKP